MCGNRVLTESIMCCGTCRARALLSVGPLADEDVGELPPKAKRRIAHRTTIAKTAPRLSFMLVEWRAGANVVDLR